ncbi:MAG TPA: SPOR domain-containing protein [Gammaproteobacteria bacterium]|nr:SPOR domain-containing protein [Gammaproteobacteria bacterium]
MRTLFLALLLANLLLFGWYYRQQPSGTQVRHRGVTLHANVPHLRQLESGSVPAYRKARQPPGGEAAAAAGSAPGGGSVKATPVGATCLSVGPYASRHAAEADAVRYQQAGLKVDRRRVSDQFRVGTWVYLGPFHSQRAAQKQVARLHRMGVHDLYLVADPRWRNAVSLGLYSKRASVTRRVRELHRLGVHPEVRVRYRSRERFWLTVHPADGGQSLEGPSTPSPTAPNAHAVRVPCSEIAAVPGQG